MHTGQKQTHMPDGYQAPSAEVPEKTKRAEEHGRIRRINAWRAHHRMDNNGTDEPWLLLFKSETHNHPTEIEPFGSAATTINGAIRDAGQPPRRYVPSRASLARATSGARQGYHARQAAAARKW